MDLNFSVLSKTKLPETLGEVYILFFANKISCLNCRQPDVCGICTSGVKVKTNDIGARALPCIARVRKGFRGEDPDSFLSPFLDEHQEMALPTDKHQVINGSRHRPTNDLLNYLFNLAVLRP